MPLPVDPRNPAASWLYRFAAWFAFALMRVQRWRVSSRGLEYVPRTGGGVLAANHTSFWDFFTVGHSPYLGWGRPVRILAKESLFRAPVFGFFMRRADHIPVHRGAGSAALSSAVAALRQGELVLVLPEQTVSPSFELLPYKTGAARMAADAGVPLIPCVSWGSHRFHTIGRRPRWSWRLPVVVAYGQPLHPGAGDDPDEVTAELRRRTAALLDEVQRTYPDGMPRGAWWVPARLGGGAPTPEQAEEHLARLAQTWREAAAERVGHARDRLHDAGDHARDRLHDAGDHARERLHDGVEHARERLHDAGDLARRRREGGQAPGDEHSAVEASEVEASEVEGSGTG